MTDRLLLGTWPTPLEPLPRLAAHLGTEPDALLLKRDDLTGLGAGGNKVRKLEPLLAEATAQGADLLVTSGAAQSNHARITAAAAARLGLDCVLVLWGDPPAEARGNLLLDALAGAELVWVGDGDTEAVVAQVAAERRTAGRSPYVVPYGGSSPLSATGYVRCAEELQAQVPDLDLVVTAVGSGGTMAGLVAGLGADRVLGVDTGAVPDAAAAVEGLLAGMGVAHGALRIDGDRVGDGYSTVGDEVRSALRLVARTEGVFLDPIYTGRAAAGLVAALNGPDGVPGRRVVLLHSGGLPGLLARDDVL
ncbi:D-cysteine desulfhydrase [Marmoricola endophyticus]|uniref:D-cysteine desulfhydrase n=1 Tax=Marmoricola endophyticus TaxID=2040280 RepID=A0A917BIB7_9ACTN|nr:D-cysteine desulfhydrase family protein [Marmoricola endophyticus]GGF44537.1 D-cysteine desulfhydrase [Marmoricola endophyticus]